ncbi:MAG: hypothetical protein ACE5FN_02675 [Leptospirillia bacterium]
MNPQTQWAAFGLMGLALMVSVGLSMAFNNESDAVWVSMSDYQDVTQERMGNAVVLEHYVNKAREMGQDWTWQTRKGHETTISHFRNQSKGNRQEAMGWEITTGNVVAGWKGSEQELMGWEYASERMNDRIRGMQQEWLGVQYMIRHQADRNS